MNVLFFTIFVFLCSFGAGFFGSLTGLGGGALLVPILTLVLGVNPYYAMGASLIAVIATSSGASVAFMKEGFTNHRVGIFLETSAVIGAIIGASIVTKLPLSFLGILFGIVLLYSALITLKEKKQSHQNIVSSPLAYRFSLNGEYVSSQGEKICYQTHRIGSAWMTMLVAGGLSGVLGIGSGAVKVLAMDHFMGLPYKVSTATSNFMIGLTAAASAGIYLSHGYIDPIICMPVMLGVLSGSTAGARIMVKAKSQKLRYIFAVITIFLGIEMIIKSLMGKL